MPKRQDDFTPVVPQGSDAIERTAAVERNLHHRYLFFVKNPRNFEDMLKRKIAPNNGDQTALFD